MAINHVQLIQGVMSLFPNLLIPLLCNPLAWVLTYMHIKARTEPCETLRIPCTQVVHT